jgi:hypothetical protein
MAASFRMAQESALRALRSVSPRSYAPLGLLLLVQVGYLLLGLDLGSTLGMATAGMLARWIAGPAAMEYPAFLQFLPVTFSYIESVTFVVIGAWALPRVAATILANSDPVLADRARRRARVGRALFPTFLGLASAFALMYIWQQIVPHVARPILGLILHGGFEMATATWAVSVGVGYAILTLFVYVPIVAVASEIAPMEAFRRGVREGLNRFWFTLPIAILFSLPALLVQLVVQVRGSFIASRTQPENIAYLLLAYAVLGSVGTYLLWSTATRLHKLAEVAR